MENIKNTDILILIVSVLIILNIVFFIKLKLIHNDIKHLKFIIFEQYIELKG